MPEDAHNAIPSEGKRFRLATIAPQSARMEVAIAQLDAEYYGNLTNLRKIVRRLRRRNGQRP